MATKKNTKKSNVKTFVVDLIVDLTGCECAADVYERFAEAKIDRYLTPTEMEIFTDRNMITMFVCEGECPFCKAEEEKKAKKPNIFTRFWNWITRKK